MSDVQNSPNITRGDTPLTDQEIALALTQSWVNQERMKQTPASIFSVYESALEKVRELNK